MPSKLKTQLENLTIGDCTSADLSIMDLPDDVVARILEKLDAASLSSTEWVCQRFRGLVIEHELWKALCTRACPQLARVNTDISIEGLISEAARRGGRKRGRRPQPPSRAVLRSSAFYRLHTELAAPDMPYSLLAHTLAASSTDNPEEDARNVLTPNHRFIPLLGARSGSYWSSKGSDDQGSSEWLLFQLAHPLCLVKSVSIRPFLAFFQRGHPIYSAKEVRFVFSCAQSLRDGCGGAGADEHTQQQQQQPLLDGPAHASSGELSSTPSGGSGSSGGGDGGGSCGETAAADDAQGDGFAFAGSCGRFRPFQTVTLPMPMEKADKLQTFELDEPVLCVGGRLKVELVGRVQRQEQDALWYTCINHVRVLGKPLHNFVPALPPELPAGPSAAAAAGGGGGSGGRGRLVLRLVRSDPMVAAGGLMKLSEGGMLEERLALEARNAMLGGDQVDDGDSDEDGDMADLMPVAGFGGVGLLPQQLLPPHAPDA